MAGTPFKKPRPSGYNCYGAKLKTCFICGQTVEELGGNWCNIFESDRMRTKRAKPKNYHIRLANVLEIPPLKKEDVVKSYYCICRRCIGRLEKIEKGLRILQEFRRDYMLRREKRDRVDSLAPVEREVEQLTTQNDGSKTTVLKPGHPIVTSDSEPVLVGLVHPRPVGKNISACASEEQDHASVVDSQQFLQTGIQSQKDTPKHSQNVPNQLQQQVQTTSGHTQTSQGSNHTQLVTTQWQNVVTNQTTCSTTTATSKAPQVQTVTAGTQIGDQTLQIGQQNLQIQQVADGQLTFTPQPTQQQRIILPASKPQIIALQTLNNVQGIPQIITLPMQRQTIGQQLSGANIFLQTPQGLQTIQPGQALYQNSLILGSNNAGVETLQIQPLNIFESRQQQTSTTNAITTVPCARTTGDQQEQISQKQTSTLASKGQGEDSDREESSSDDVTEDGRPDTPAISLEVTIKTEEPDEDFPLEEYNSLTTGHNTESVPCPQGHHQQVKEEESEQNESDQISSSNPEISLEDEVIDGEAASDYGISLQRQNVEWLVLNKDDTPDESRDGVERSIESMLPLETQEKSHAEGRPFQCTYCDKRFTCMEQLITHESLYTKERPFQCSFCQKRYKYKWDITRHERSHRGERPFKCSFCEKRFTAKHSLTHHERMHRGERPYQCRHCEKRYTCQSSLTAHESLHTGLRRFHCSYCEKGFTSKILLTSHECLHTGERPFQCAYCTKKFTSKQNLTHHERLHTGERPYPCRYCEKTFTSKGNLRRHEYLHIGHRPY